MSLRSGDFPSSSWHAVQRNSAEAGTPPADPRCQVWRASGSGNPLGAKLMRNERLGALSIMSPCCSRASAQAPTQTGLSSRR